MALVISELLDELTISGSALDAFIADSSNVLTLEVSYNCGSAISHVISIDDVDIGNAEYTVTAVDLGYSSVFVEGVYRFRLRYQDNPVTITTYYSYLNASITCRLIDWYGDRLECLEKNPCDSNIFYWVYVFDDLLTRFAVGSCSDFTYSNACKIYSKLKELLNDSSDDDCGCD